jgi:hypothetical protein
MFFDRHRGLFLCPKNEIPQILEISGCTFLKKTIFSLSHNLLLSNETIVFEAETPFLGIMWQVLMTIKTLFFKGKKLSFLMKST